MKKLENKINMLKHESGFTLIEMLIVVAIIGIIVAIAIPALGTAKTDAQTAKQNAIITAVEVAKIRYSIANTVAANSTSTAVLTHLTPFLLVNGAQVNSVTQLTQGTGKTAVTMGTYQGSTGTATPFKFN